MSFEFRWVGASEEELDRVADTRLRCYGHCARGVEQFKAAVRADPRARPGDFLIAERDGAPVGTATALPLTMWLRGAPIPCQGITQVGTIKNYRRRSSHASDPGIATRLLHEALRMGRERGDVLSALTPFRGSFYERSGFGLIERRCKWTVPLSVLPIGPFEGIRFHEPADLPELRRCRQRVVERGQCDIERPDAVWDWVLRQAQDGFVAVDRPACDGPIRGWAYFRHSHADGKDLLRVVELGYDDVPTLLRMMHFLASLKDQYASAVLPLPTGLPFNRLLRETQVPHRTANHATAECRPFTRMQARVLDSKRLIEPMRLPSNYRGEAWVAVHETGEGETGAGENGAGKGRNERINRFRVELADGRAQVTPGAASTGPASRAGPFECRDITWSAVVCGDLPATLAVSMGLARDGGAAPLLDAFARGAAPFSTEDF